MGTLRTLLLLLSPRFSHGRLTNLFLLWRTRRSAGGRKVLQSYFNAAYYLARYPDVAGTSVDPLWHYLLQGFHERRDPSSRFNTRDYLRQYPDVAKAGLNPLLHYASYGKRENRTTARSPSLALGASNARLPDKRTILQNTQCPDGTPLVSVVVLSSPPAEAAVRSVLSQTFTRLELIVMVGSSSEASGPDTRILHRTAQPGASRNEVMSTARGRYVCCIDADDLLTPIYLEVAVFLAEGYGHHIVYPSAPEPSGCGRKGIVQDACLLEVLEANPIFGAVLVRKDAWARIGGYREWGPQGSRALEDWDLWVRLLAQGSGAIGVDARSLVRRALNRNLTAGCETGAESQKELLHKANAALLEDTAPEPEPSPVEVLSPWINLQGKADEKPGFLLALPFITVGGAETLLRNISRMLVDRGVRVLVITTLDLPETVKDDSATFEQVTTHIYPLLSLFGDQEERWEDFLRYLLVHYNVSAIMIAGSEFIYRVLPAIRREFPGVRVVDQLFNEEVHLPNNRHYAEHIDVTIVPSRGFADTLLNRYRERPERVAVIPHGVFTGGLQREVRAAALGASGIPAAGRGKFLVSFFGRLSPEKAPDVFVEIVRHLREHDEIYFCMTGEGQLRSEILGLIQRYKLQSRIYTPGFVEDVGALMELSDVVVVPSRFDGMPLVVLEAQALGKPVIASSVGSIPEMITDNESGFLCTPGDVPAFAERILELLGSVRRRGEIGAAALAAVRQRHDLETMMGDYMTVLRGVQQSNNEQAVRASKEIIL